MGVHLTKAAQQIIQLAIHDHGKHVSHQLAHDITDILLVPYLPHCQASPVQCFTPINQPGISSSATNNQGRPPHRQACHPLLKLPSIMLDRPGMKCISNEAGGFQFYKGPLPRPRRGFWPQLMNVCKQLGSSHERPRKHTLGLGPN